MADAEAGGLNVAALQQAVDSLLIRDVYLRRSSIEVADEFIPKLNKKALEVQLRWGPRQAREMEWRHDTGDVEKVFLVEIETAIRFIDKDGGNLPSDQIKPKATFGAVFLAEYKVNTQEQIAEESIKQFVQHNVIYHVWPYWREFLQSMCARTQMPNFALPMYVVRAKSDKAKS